MLRLAVNVRSLVPGGIGGLEHAFRDTFDGLLARHGGELAVTLLTSDLCDGAFTGVPRSVTRRRIAGGAGPAEVAAVLRGHDVLWCPLMYLDPLRPPIPAVVTIPDLQHLTHPEFFATSELALRIRDLRPSVAFAARVLTPSEFSRTEIVRAYGVPAERVVAVPHDLGAVFEAPRDAARVAALRWRHRLDRPYCLYPARPWPHKNHATLLRALSLYRDRFGPPPLLALCGFAPDASLRRAAAARGLRDVVRQLGWLPRADLPPLYDGAAMLVFPSLFEGFGLPVVEALRRGVPVVASASTSLPEVLGDAGLLVEPGDAGALADAMHRVLTERRETAARVERGLARAPRWSEGRAADATWEVLRAAASRATPARSAAAPARRPKVLVVTPSYDQAAFLRETIESVLSQDYAELEYFVADGGSTDGSVAILEEYGDRLRWSSGPDGGQAAAVRAAWQATDAEIVAWLNSDDTYCEGAVSAAVAFLDENPDLSMVYGEAWLTDARGARIGVYPTWKPFRRAALARNCFICQPATFVRREVLHVVDPPDPTLRCALDYDLWIRLSAHFRVGHLDRFLATSRVHDAAKSTAERDTVYAETVAVARRHFGYVHTEWITGWLHHRFRRLLGRSAALLPVAVRRALFAVFPPRASRRRQSPSDTTRTTS